MVSILHAVLYGSIALFVYAWVGYPLLLKVWRSSQSGRGPSGDFPGVTVLITAWNGEGKIAERLRDVLSQEYPPDRLRIFVASDGSTDRTFEEARSLCDPRVTVRRFPRGGKSATQNAAIREIVDEVIVFTDVDTHFAPGFLRELVRPFCDPKVGCVSGRLVFAKVGQPISEGQSVYWTFEMWLRSQESRLGLLSAATGACMACRRALLRPLMDGCGEDCTIPLDVISQGHTVVHAGSAVAYDEMPATLKGELHARARMTCRNLRGTTAYPRLLNPVLHPRYALSLWSHKLLRWMTPLLVISAFLSSLALYPEFRPLVWAELVVITLSVVGVALSVARLPQGRLFSIPFSFLVANIGFFMGIIQFLRGRSFSSYRNVAFAAGSSKAGAGALMVDQRVNER